MERIFFPLKMGSGMDKRKREEETLDLTLFGDYAYVHPNLFFTIIAHPFHKRENIFI